jgi:peptidoglycan/LPS O-acetylase OafA/YrhL
MSQSFRHFPQLDGWRGVSIILVLIGHSLAYSLLLPPPFNTMDDFATLGVLCFFILSGFLITGLLLNEEKLTGKISLARFYCRRVLRIIPAYYFFIAVIAILASFKAVTDVSWHTIVVCFLFLRDIAGRGITMGHAWSLSLEEQFYLLWPFVLSKLPAKHRCRIVFSACVIIAIWRSIAINSGILQSANTFRPDFRFDCILVGCLLALLRQEKQELLFWVSRKIKSPIIVTIVLLLWTLLAYKIPGSLPIYITAQLWLAALLFCLLIAEDNSQFAKALSAPVLIWFGKISYSLYLWQQLFIVTKSPPWGLIRYFPFDLFCAIIVSSLSYYLIERPFLKLKDKFAEVK